MNTESLRIGFWVPGGLPHMLQLEGAIAYALQDRGHEVQSIICDGRFFKACMAREVDDGTTIQQWGDRCSSCIRSAKRALKIANLAPSTIGEFITESEVSNLREIARGINNHNVDDFTFRGHSVGRHVRASVVRYFKGQSMTNVDEIIYQFALTSLVVSVAAQNYVDRYQPDRMFMSHGVYSDWGPALQVFLKLKIHSCIWMSSYQSTRFYIRAPKDDLRINAHISTEEFWQSIKDVPLTQPETELLQDYLNRRYSSVDCIDIKNVQKFVPENIDRLRRTLNFNNSNPIWAILTHVVWDASSVLAPLTYSSYEDWAIKTIEHAINNPKVNWIIKVHPGELLLGSARSLVTTINERFPQLPEHIRLIPATFTSSPLEFIHLIDGGVTCHGTAGLELLLQGKPVVLAGEAHYGQKGFTHDGYTPDKFGQLMASAQWLPKLSSEQLSLVHRYAYAFFIRRQIPLPPLKDPFSDWWHLQKYNLPQLKAGQDPFIDFVCDCIITKKEFILPKNMVNLAKSPFAQTSKIRMLHLYISRYYYHQFRRHFVKILRRFIHV